MWLCKRDLSKECEGKYRDCTDCVLDKVRAEIMQLDYDIENIYFDYNDREQIEVVHTICREEVLQIIDQYKEESEEER